MRLRNKHIKYTLLLASIILLMFAPANYAGSDKVGMIAKENGEEFRNPYSARFTDNGTEYYCIERGYPTTYYGEKSFGAINDVTDITNTYVKDGPAHKMDVGVAFVIHQLEATGYVDKQKIQGIIGKTYERRGSYDTETPTLKRNPTPYGVHLIESELAASSPSGKTGKELVDASNAYAAFYYGALRVNNGELKLDFINDNATVMVDQIDKEYIIGPYRLEVHNFHTKDIDKAKDGNMNELTEDPKIQLRGGALQRLAKQYKTDFDALMSYVKANNSFYQQTITINGKALDQSGSSAEQKAINDAIRKMVITDKNGKVVAKTDANGKLVSSPEFGKQFYFRLPADIKILKTFKPGLKVNYYKDVQGVAQFYDFRGDESRYEAEINRLATSDDEKLPINFYTQAGEASIKGFKEGSREDFNKSYSERREEEEEKDEDTDYDYEDYKEEKFKVYGGILAMYNPVIQRIGEFSKDVHIVTAKTETECEQEVELTIELGGSVWKEKQLDKTGDYNGIFDRKDFPFLKKKREETANKNISKMKYQDNLSMKDFAKLHDKDIEAYAKANNKKKEDVVKLLLAPNTSADYKAKILNFVHVEKEKVLKNGQNMSSKDFNKYYGPLIKKYADDHKMDIKELNKKLNKNDKKAKEIKEQIINSTNKEVKDLAYNNIKNPTIKDFEKVYNKEIEQYAKDNKMSKQQVITELEKEKTPNSELIKETVKTKYPGKISNNDLLNTNVTGEEFVKYYQSMIGYYSQLNLLDAKEVENKIKANNSESKQLMNNIKNMTSEFALDIAGPIKASKEYTDRDSALIISNSGKTNTNSDKDDAYQKYLKEKERIEQIHKEETKKAEERAKEQAEKDRREREGLPPKKSGQQSVANKIKNQSNKAVAKKVSDEKKVASTYNPKIDQEILDRHETLSNPSNVRDEKKTGSTFNPKIDQEILDRHERLSKPANDKYYYDKYLSAGASVNAKASKSESDSIYDYQPVNMETKNLKADKGAYQYIVDFIDNKPTKLYMEVVNRFKLPLSLDRTYDSLSQDDKDMYATCKNIYFKSPDPNPAASNVAGIYGYLFGRPTANQEELLKRHDRYDLLDKNYEDLTAQERRDIARYKEEDRVGDSAIVNTQSVSGNNYGYVNGMPRKEQSDLLIRYNRSDLAFKKYDELTDQDKADIVSYKKNEMFGTDYNKTEGTSTTETRSGGITRSIKELKTQDSYDDAIMYLNGMPTKTVVEALMASEYSPLANVPYELLTDHERKIIENVVFSRFQGTPQTIVNYITDDYAVDWHGNAANRDDYKLAYINDEPSKLVAEFLQRAGKSKLASKKYSELTEEEKEEVNRYIQILNGDPAFRIKNYVGTASGDKVVTENTNTDKKEEEKKDDKKKDDADKALEGEQYEDPFPGIQVYLLKFEPKFSGDKLSNADLEDVDDDRMNNGNYIKVDSICTDEDGFYQFKELDPFMKYRVVFKYNGEYYEDTYYKNYIGVPGGFSNASEAYVGIKNRENFNNKFVHVKPAPSSYLIDKKGNTGFAYQLELTDSKHDRIKKLTIKEALAEFHKEASKGPDGKPRKTYEEFSTTQFRDYLVGKGVSQVVEKDDETGLSEVDKVIKFLTDTMICSFTKQYYPVYHRFAIRESDGYDGTKTPDRNKNYAFEKEHKVQTLTMGFEDADVQVVNGKPVIKTKASSKNRKDTKYACLYSPYSDQRFYIDFGVYFRGISDLGLIKDLYKARIIVNGKMQDYKYRARDTNKDGVWYIKTRFSNVGYFQDRYTRELRKSEYLRKFDNENKDGKSVRSPKNMQVFLTYLIQVRNLGSFDMSVDEIVDYYDAEQFTFDGIEKIETVNGKERKVYEPKTYNLYDDNGNVKGTYQTSFLGKDEKFNRLKIGDKKYDGLKFSDTSFVSDSKPRELVVKNKKFKPLYITGIKSAAGEDRLRVGPAGELLKKNADKTEDPEGDPKEQLTPEQQKTLKEAKENKYNPLVNPADQDLVINDDGSVGGKEESTPEPQKEEPKKEEKKDNKPVDKALEDKIKNRFTRDAYVYLTFKVNIDPETDRVFLDQYLDTGKEKIGKKNVAEINAYSSYYPDKSLIPHELGDKPGELKKKDVSNKPAGIFDVNSIAGDVRDYNLDDDGNIIEARAENDMDAAPPMKLIIEKPGENARRYKGFAFEDKREVNKDKAIIGDGIYKDKNDVKIDGVGVKLYEMISNVDENGINKNTYSSYQLIEPIKITKLGKQDSVQKGDYDYYTGKKETLIMMDGPSGTILSVSDKDKASLNKDLKQGDYAISEFSAGDYYIQFEYGNKDRTALGKNNKSVVDLLGAKPLNNVAYNGQDFKTTIYDAGKLGDTKVKYKQFTGFNNPNDQTSRPPMKYQEGNVMNLSKLFYHDIKYAEKKANVNKSFAIDDSQRRDETIKNFTTRLNTLDEVASSAEKIGTCTYRQQNKDNKSGGIYIDYSRPKEVEAARNTGKVKEYQRNLVDALEKLNGMVAFTGVFNNEIEKTRLQTSKQTKNNVSTYDVTGLNIGLVERPKAQLMLDKRVTNVKYAIANIQTIFNTDKSEGSVAFGDHSSHLAKYRDTILDSVKIHGDRKNNADQITAYLDDELMKGGSLEIKYGLTVKNVGEVDYRNKEFYYFGIDPKDISTTTCEEVVDYVVNKIKFVPGDQINTASKWNVYQDSLLIPSYFDKNNYGSTEYTSFLDDKINREYSDIIDSYTNIIVSTGLNKKLEPEIKNEGASTANIELVLKTDTINNTEDDSLQFNNLAEVAKISNDQGRRTQFSVVGNQYMQNQHAGQSAKEGRAGIDRVKIMEVDADTAQQVNLLPPTGANKNIIPIIIASIVGAGIVLVLVIRMKKYNNSLTNKN